jgi:hypothetical protein
MPASFEKGYFPEFIGAKDTSTQDKPPAAQESGQRNKTVLERIIKIS